MAMRIGFDDSLILSAVEALPGAARELMELSTERGITGGFYDSFIRQITSAAAELIQGIRENTG